MESTYFNEEIETSMIKLKDILREENDDLSPLPDLDKLGPSSQQKEKRLAGFIKMLRNKTMSLQVLIEQAKAWCGNDWMQYLNDQDREYVTHAVHAIVASKLKQSKEDAEAAATKQLPVVPKKRPDYQFGDSNQYYGSSQERSDDYRIKQNSLIAQQNWEKRNREY